jgi:hypothetical protein
LPARFEQPKSNPGLHEAIAEKIDLTGKRVFPAGREELLG